MVVQSYTKLIPYILEYVYLYVINKGFNGVLLVCLSYVLL